MWQRRGRQAGPTARDFARPCQAPRRNSRRENEPAGSQGPRIDTPLASPAEKPQQRRPTAPDAPAPRPGCGKRPPTRCKLLAMTVKWPAGARECGTPPRPTSPRPRGCPRLTALHRRSVSLWPQRWRPAAPCAHWSLRPGAHGRGSGAQIWAGRPCGSSNLGCCTSMPRARKRRPSQGSPPARPRQTSAAQTPDRGAHDVEDPRHQHSPRAPPHATPQGGFLAPCLQLQGGL
mmetsp:Transcript_12554/g.26197  ORF Transcript_12554/g.26197 Transcript_12554/m.26197 type:complete len:232 (+) Transcript_12554:402-1097(+)